MAFVKLALILVVILLINYGSARPQEKDNNDKRNGGLDLSVDKDNKGNTNVRVDVEHKINDKTSVFGQH